jgi:Family of unknown function (DUF6210)
MVLFCNGLPKEVVMAQCLIRVWETESLGLIILKNTGVVIANQTGGYACIESKAEGIYVPLRSHAHELEAFFQQQWGMDGSALDETAADFIDNFLGLDGNGNLNFIKLDRTRLENSHEAWVHVNVSIPDGDQRISLINGFGVTHGILTWPNSD